MLKSLVIRASKYLDSLKVAEKKTEILREQLVAAEKLISANRQQADKTKSQVGVVISNILANGQILRPCHCHFKDLITQVNEVVPTIFSFL